MSGSVPTFGRLLIPAGLETEMQIVDAVIEAFKHVPSQDRHHFTGVVSALEREQSRLWERKLLDEGEGLWQQAKPVLEVRDKPLSHYGAFIRRFPDGRYALIDYDDENRFYSLTQRTEKYIDFDALIARDEVRVLCMFRDDWPVLHDEIIKHPLVSAAAADPDKTRLKRALLEAVAVEEAQPTQEKYAVRALLSELLERTSNGDNFNLLPKDPQITQEIPESGELFVEIHHQESGAREFDEANLWRVEGANGVAVTLLNMKTGNLENRFGPNVFDPAKSRRLGRASAAPSTPGTPPVAPSAKERVFGFFRINRPEAIPQRQTLQKLLTRLRDEQPANRLAAMEEIDRQWLQPEDVSWMNADDVRKLIQGLTSMGGKRDLFRRWSREDYLNLLQATRLLARIAGLKPLRHFITRRDEESMFAIWLQFMSDFELDDPSAVWLLGSLSQLPNFDRLLSREVGGIVRRLIANHEEDANFSKKAGPMLLELFKILPGGSPLRKAIGQKWIPVALKDILGSNRTWRWSWEVLAIAYASPEPEWTETLENAVQPLLRANLNWNQSDAHAAFLKRAFPNGRSWQRGANTTFSASMLPLALAVPMIAISAIILKVFPKMGALRDVVRQSPVLSVLAYAAVIAAAFKPEIQRFLSTNRWTQGLFRSA